MRCILRLLITLGPFGQGLVHFQSSPLASSMRRFSDRLATTSPAHTESKVHEDRADEGFSPLKQFVLVSSRRAEKAYKNLIDVLGLLQTVEILEVEYRNLPSQELGKAQEDESAVKRYLFSKGI
jgi:hypothetical protein